jgi:type IV pilus assembly protein PilY1
VPVNKVLWEWSNAEVKYSYGRPVIVKVRDSAYPYGRWVVLVTGGYDNASGLGKIFVLDAKTGTLLRTITTTAGAPPGSGLADDSVDRSGLAQIHAFVKNQGNQIAEQIYGGDLLGNVWRVDVSVPDSYLTASPVLFAQLVDPSGNPQPVTVAPQIEIDISNGVDRYVFIGTGRLLDTSDLTNPSTPQTQTMYAIRDGTLQTPSTTGLPIQTTRGSTLLKPINPDGISAVAGGAPDGWYHDLPDVAPDAQRMVVDPQSNLNVAAYVGTKVQNDPCVISLPRCSMRVTTPPASPGRGQLGHRSNRPGLSQRPRGHHDGGNDPERRLPDHRGVGLAGNSGHQACQDHQQVHGSRPAPFVEAARRGMTLTM